jgi:hypothetical protein
MPERVFLHLDLHDQPARVGDDICTANELLSARGSGKRFPGIDLAAVRHRVLALRRAVLGEEPVRWPAYPA